MIKHIYETRDLYDLLSKLNEWHSEVSKNHLLCA